MTTLILFLVLAGFCGFAFHFFFGKTARSIPFYLLAAFGGATVGFTAAKLLDWNFWTVGGLPILLTALGAVLFLSLARRVQVEE
ncbi:MAG TPA: hypothetical protein VH186_20705 [Chloroflexia bacterium]|nr:hypothetical protein [Chloroflexia bacterium]